MTNLTAICLLVLAISNLIVTLIQIKINRILEERTDRIESSLEKRNYTIDVLIAGGKLYEELEKIKEKNLAEETNGYPD